MQRGSAGLWKERQYLGPKGKKSEKNRVWAGAFYFLSCLIPSDTHSSVVTSYCCLCLWTWKHQFVFLLSIKSQAVFLRRCRALVEELYFQKQPEGGG